MTAWVIALRTVYRRRFDGEPDELHLIKDKIYEVTDFTDDGEPFVICEDGSERYIFLADPSPHAKLVSPLELLAQQASSDGSA